MPLRSGLLALALLASLPLSAQETPAIRAARAHFQATAAHADGRRTSSDLADLAASSAHRDARSGVTFVYLAQRVNGVEVLGTVTAAAANFLATPRFDEIGPAVTRHLRRDVRDLLLVRGLPA